MQIYCPVIGTIGGKYGDFLLLIQKIHSYICRWLINEMMVWEMFLDMIIMELVMQPIYTSVLWNVYVLLFILCNSNVISPQKLPWF